jgi:serine/threonine-protein kinase HipA
LVEPVDTAFVKLWDDLVGAVAWDQERGISVFEYEPSFLQRNLDIAPLHMPISQAVRGSVKFSFPGLEKNTYKGLPGLLADALPDNFGNRIIDRWLAEQGRTAQDFSPVERLCYTGTRAMGALEFSPLINAQLEESVPIEIAELIDLAQRVIDERENLQTSISGSATTALLDILRVGTSAGGNRPKAVIAINDKTSDIRSGQVTVPPEFTHWIIKFDGVKDTGLGDPAGYGLIEYAYYKMALKAGIIMTECRILPENERSHFLSRRFDRGPYGSKLHMQSLCALAHFDFNQPGSYSYEQAFQVMRELRLPYNDAEQLFIRMVFNILARNQDDHTKNISFLMDKSGKWSLSPAYDVIYSYNPSGKWTSRHQMSVNGKRDDFNRDDLLKVAGEMNIKSARDIIERINQALSEWPQIAKASGVAIEQISRIQKVHRHL